MDESKAHKKPIPFSPPRIDEESIAEVVDTLRSGWITTGPKTKEFEKRITSYCGAKKTICLNSATAAMEMALRWYGIGEGDEVIIPAYTYCATANVVLHSGAKPVMVDVNEDDFNISINAIKAAITNKTKAIVPVDIAGYPCDYDELYDLVNSAEIRDKFQAKNDLERKLGRIMILADAAHSFGAVYKGRTSGSLADASAFSFHAVKNLTTAEGGALVFNLDDSFNLEEIYSEINTMSLHGQSKDAFFKMQIGAWRYDVKQAGYKCNMTDIHASLGLVELNRYDENLKRREEIVKSYSNSFGKKNHFQLPLFESDEKKSSFHLYLLRIKNISEAQRDEIIQKISEDKIAVNVHFIPLPELSQYKDLGYMISDYPIAYRNYSCEISLPVYYDLSDDDMDRIINSVNNAVDTIL